MIKYFFLLLIFILFSNLQVLAHSGGNMKPYYRQIIPNEKLYDRPAELKLKKININSASLEELMSLSVIDRQFAERILQIRPLQSLDDFYKISNLNYTKTKTLIEYLKDKVEF